MTFLNPPEVKIPMALQATQESGWYQSQATSLYQLWDAMRKLGTSQSTIITDQSVSESFIVACSGETTTLSAGTAKATFRIPYDFEITDISASVNNAPVGSTLLTVDIGVNGASILSTKLSFDSGEKTTRTATSQFVASQIDLVQDDEIRIDILSVGNTTAGTGLKVTITGIKL